MSLHIHCAPAPTTAPLASAGNSNAQPTVSAVLSAPGAPLSVVRLFGTPELTDHWRVLAHRAEVMPRAPGGASGGFGWSAP
jgi:hypothetical protein